MQKDDYYPFGGSFNAYSDPGTAQQNYLYNGVRFNQTSQLYETAFRTYDPYLGRFNHIDPLTAMVPGLSPYHFGFNNPVRYSDPMGLMGQDEGIWGTGNTHASKNPSGGFTGPGSGKHWSDGIGYSDWSMWGGSDMYRDGLASGGFEFGGMFYNLDGNGNRTPYEERNGRLGFWVDTPAEYRDYVLMNNKLFATLTPGVTSTFHGVGQSNGGNSDESQLNLDVFANSFFATDVGMYLVDVYSDYRLAVNEGIRQGYRKTFNGYSWTPGTLKNSNELFKGLKTATGALGKVTFGVGTAISLINMANDPTLEKVAWGLADIGVATIGLYSGTIAATLTAAGLAVPGLNLIIAGAALGYAGYRIYSNLE